MESERRKPTGGGGKQHPKGPELPARTRQLFDAVFLLCERRIEPALHATLSELGKQLFAMADRSHSDAEQQMLLDSAAEVRHGADALARRFMHALREHLEGFDAGSFENRPQHFASRTELELLATQALEEKLAADDMAARGESRASMVLFELGHRFAVLIGAPVVPADALPIGPHSMARALYRAASELEVPIPHRLELYRLFDSGVMAHMMPFYDAINELMVARGILPNLRSFLPRRRVRNGSADKTGSPPDEDAAKSNATEDVQSARASSPQPAAAEGFAEEDEETRSFAAISALLARRRMQLGTERAASGGHVASAEDLHEVLGGLQQRPAAVRGRDGTTRPRNMQQLRQDMLAQLRKNNPDAGAPRLAPEHLDVFELMTMLFDRLADDIRSTSGNDLLSRLQAPLLRVALDDRDFFTEHSHPARRWLNAVAEASAHWGADADEGDPGLIEKMGVMVTRANEAFDGDPSMFEEMTSDLDQHVDVLERKAEVTERRYVEASKGRERLELARQRAHQLISGHLEGSKVSSLTRAMLQNAWADLLALVQLREGEDSEDFRRKLEISEQLAQSTEDLDRVQLCIDVEHGLMQVGVEKEDAEALAREAIGAPQLDNSDDAVSRTELAIKLKQRQAIGGAKLEEQAAATADKPDASDQERRMMEHIKTLAFGTWFEFEDSESGAIRLRKMAWYSTRTGRCLFVNRRGARAEDTNIEQLARAMVAGSIRVQPAEAGSFIDRAWTSIVRKLKSFVSGDDTATEGAPA